MSASASTGGHAHQKYIVTKEMSFTNTPIRFDPGRGSSEAGVIRGNFANADRDGMPKNLGDMFERFCLVPCELVKRCLCSGPRLISQHPLPSNLIITNSGRLYSITATIALLWMYHSAKKILIARLKTKRGIDDCSLKP
jgi:hypothetical protein